MAIIDNRVTEEGDVLIIKTEYPVVGLIALTQFVDTTAGENQSDYFLKEFRYSVDGGITFSDWIELNILNIQAVEITKYDSFVIEYRYTRVGNAPEVELTFSDILVSGVEEDLPYPVYEKTYFHQFFNVNDINVFGWALNVLEKIYSKGAILPDFYERGDNQSSIEDEDFITYWNSITHLFAIIVYYSRQFDDISQNQTLLEEFLKSKDIFVSNDSDLVTLLYLFNNYVGEVSKRGTIQIVDQTEFGAEIDGELIRLIGHLVTEEIIFGLLRNHETGWCLSKSSPTWKGTEKMINLIKGYEYTKEVVDLSKYPLVEDSFISIESDKMKITGVTASLVSGIADTGDTVKRIVIDPSVDYEISFVVKQSAALNNINFGCKCYNVSGNEISLENVNTGNNLSYFFQLQSMKLNNKDYWVRGVIFNSGKSLQVGSKTNIGLGNNLRFKSTAVYITPEITITGNGTQTVYIDNIKVRPAKINFSRGQLGVRQILYLMTKNNNDKYSVEKLNQFIQNSLIPYKTFLKTNWL